jgi:hypothetical protein
MESRLNKNPLTAVNRHHKLTVISCYKFASNLSTKLLRLRAIVSKQSYFVRS